MLYIKSTLQILQARVKPTTPNVKSLVCAMSYYRILIPHFVHISQPLMELTKIHHKQFKWTSVHNKCFSDLIEAIAKLTSLTLLDTLKPLNVQTNASDLCGAFRK